jgi:hypothetical protein
MILVVIPTLLVVTIIPLTPQKTPHVARNHCQNGHVDDCDSGPSQSSYPHFDNSSSSSCHCANCNGHKPFLQSPVQYNQNCIYLIISC